MACYSGFLAGREAARLMVPRGKGCIFFTGATASMRGGVGYAAFASAKAGLRAVAQAAARELGPRNIHVAHLVINSGVDTAWVTAASGVEALGPNALDDPDLLMPPSSVAEVLLAALSSSPRAPGRLSWRFAPSARSGPRSHPQWSSILPVMRLRFRDEVRAFIAEKFDDDLRRKMAFTKNGYLDKAGQSELAPRPLQERLDRAGLAEGIRRHRLDSTAALHLRGRMRARRRRRLLPFGVAWSGR